MNEVVVRPFPIGRYPNAARRPVPVVDRGVGAGIIIFIGAHVLLALLIRQVSMAATVHAFATVAIGIWVAIKSRQRPERVAYVGAYVMGSEILWRMTQASVFWEFGKYATIAILVLFLIRNGRFKIPSLPLAYFLLLVPSILMTLFALEPWDARGKISFNLSGPLALMVCAWFFSGLKLTKEQLHRLLLSAIGPLVGVAVYTLFGILKSSSISFTLSSNEALSGGFGPNQVSAALGMGVLLAFLVLISGKAKLWLKALVFGAMVFLGIQSALTFSRGGLYAAAFAALLAVPFYLKDARLLIRVAPVVLILFFVASYLILPELDTFTGGNLTTRFQDTDATNRDNIIWADLEIWKENPIFGVGPGVAKFDRVEYLGKRAAAHTEFSRLVAEHGIFGFVAFILLLVMGARNFLRARTAENKALVVCFVAWSFLFMLVNAMRLAAPSFVFGLAFITLIPGIEEARALTHKLRRRGRPRQAVVIIPHPVTGNRDGSLAR